MRNLFSAILVLACCTASAQCPETFTITGSGNRCLGIDSLILNGAANPSQITWYKNNVPAITNKASFYSAGSIAGGNGAGSSATQLRSPYAVFVDKAGNIYVADRLNHRVQRFPPGGGTGLTVAGGNGFGPALNQLAFPSGVQVDNGGNIFISDYNNHRIVKWAPGATSGTVVAGGNGQGAAMNQLNSPRGLFVDKAGAIYIADMNNHRIVKWAPGAASGLVVAGGNGQGIAANQLDFPGGVVVDTAGNVYIADGNPRIQKWAPGAAAGVTVAGTGEHGSAANQLSGASSVFIDRLGNLLIGDGNNDRIQRWAPGANTGETIAGGNGRGNGTDQLAFPSGLYVDSTGNIFICDNINHRIQKWLPGISKVLGPANVPGPGMYKAVITTFSGCSYTTGNVNVFPSGTPRAIVSVNTYQSICSSDTVRFFSYVNKHGIVPSYQWIKNDIDIAGETQVNFTSTGFVTGDKIKCRITCNANGCLSADVVVSNVESISVGSVYTFTGNGNWEDAQNWNGGKIPPQVLPKCAQIIINPAGNGECILNGGQIISKGASFVVIPGKKLKVTGDVVIHDGIPTTSGLFYFTDTASKGLGVAPPTTPLPPDMAYAEDDDTSSIPAFGRPLALPSSWNLDLPPPRHQQGASCVGWAVGYGALSYFYKIIEGNPSYNGDDKIVSPAFIWNSLVQEYPNPSENQGIEIYNALDFIKEYGCCKWVDMPGNIPVPPIPLPDATAFSNALLYMNTGFSWSRPRFVDIEAIKIQLNKNYPVVIACSVGHGFIGGYKAEFVLKSQGRYVWIDKPDYGMLGSHAMVICGYDDNINAFKVQNSWGSSWGNNAGYVWIDYDFFKRAIDMDKRSNCPEIYYLHMKKPAVPLTTTSAQNITDSSAIVGGSVVNNAGISISERGICYSKNNNPTTGSSLSTNFTKVSGSGSGSFSTNLRSLQANTLYYYRAYAKTAQGIVYSRTDSFRTLDRDTSGVFTDSRDGQQYPYKKIGTQVWMTKNFNYAAPGSVCYNNNAANCTTYGRLYDWNTALTAAPPGWHLPSQTEWTTLTDFLTERICFCMYDDTLTGGKMKSTSSLWQSPNLYATNSSGWSGLPGGIHNPAPNEFNGITLYGSWWSSTATINNGADAAFIRTLDYYSGYVAPRESTGKWLMLSVRYIRD